MSGKINIRWRGVILRVVGGTILYAIIWGLVARFTQVSHSYTIPWLFNTTLSRWWDVVLLPTYLLLVAIFFGSISKIPYRQGKWQNVFYGLVNGLFGGFAVGLILGYHGLAAGIRVGGGLGVIYGIATGIGLVREQKVMGDATEKLKTKIQTVIDAMYGGTIGGYIGAGLGTGLIRGMAAAAIVGVAAMLFYCLISFLRVNQFVRIFLISGRATVYSEIDYASDIAKTEALATTCLRCGRAFMSGELRWKIRIGGSHCMICMSCRKTLKKLAEWHFISHIGVCIALVIMTIACFGPWFLPYAPILRWTGRVLWGILALMILWSSLKQHRRLMRRILIAVFLVMFLVMFLAMFSFSDFGIYSHKVTGSKRLFDGVGWEHDFAIKGLLFCLVAMLSKEVINTIITKECEFLSYLEKKEKKNSATKSLKVDW